MQKDLTETFFYEHQVSSFLDEELILPISIDDSIIFKYDEKTGEFDFDSEKHRAEEFSSKYIQVEEFYNDLSELKLLCHSANPSKIFKAWMSFWPVLVIMLTSIILLIIWIVLILDLVILAAEIYVLKKLKNSIWTWKISKVDEGWVKEIEQILVRVNEKYVLKGLIWKFDSDVKCIQLTTCRTHR